MKLYYSPGACSLASHIVLREAGIPFSLIQVDLTSKKLAESGRDYLSVTKKGYVPALEIREGEVLTEGAIILQYIADQSPGGQLAPSPGTFDRVRLNEWLHFIATELQKGSGPLVHPAANDELKAVLRPRVYARFEYLADALVGKDYLVHERFTIADAYAYYVLRHRKRYDGISAKKLSVLDGYIRRIESRASVQAALSAEQLPGALDA